MHVPRIRVLDPLRAATILCILAVAIGAARPAGAQSADDSALFTPGELEELVAPIALYPDDLVAIVLPASTYPLDVVEAARFLDELEDDPSLAPDEEWDDSIVALLNYPDVLRLMDEDLDWTWDLGEAFLNQQPEVFDAIQRFRVQVREAGNLTSDERQVVTESDGAIRIAPADPQVIYVPYYEPREIVVYHHAPIRYYPRPYPVYYYPYPSGHSFWSGYFWGVTTAFVIGWHTHHLHVHDHLHIGHPYYRSHYYEPYYVRRSIGINIVNIDRDVYVWQPRHHRIGGRPGRVTVTREGVVRADYGTRRYVSRGDTSRRTVTAGGQRSVSSSERTIGGVAATGRSRAAARSSAPTQRGAATTSRGAAVSGGRVTTREGIVRALGAAGDRDARSSAAARGNLAASNRSANEGRTASSPSRSTPRSSRGIGSSSRSTPSSTRSTGSSSRSTPSSSRGLGSTSRSTPSSTRGSASSSRTITGGRGSARTSRGVTARSGSAGQSSFAGVSSSRSAPSRSTAPSSRGTPRSASRSSQATRSPASRSSSVRSANGSARRSAIGTRSTR